MTTILGSDCFDNLATITSQLPSLQPLLLATYQTNQSAPTPLHLFLDDCSLDVFPVLVQERLFQGSF
jgi:hypothetical protein